MKLKSFSQFNENKLWYKSIPQFLEMMEKYPENIVFIDTETTGLGGSRVQQLTQVSGIVVNKNFNEISEFDQKIELTDEIKHRMEQDPEFPKGLKVDGKKQMNPWSTKKILKFNHYKDGDYEYLNEKDVIDNFFNWLKDYEPYALVAQNAIFDMNMLGGRYGHKINSPVIDTKEILQFYFLPLIQTLSETDPKFKNMVDSIGFSSRDNGLISSSMAKIGPALNLDMTKYHDALTDCRITIEMYKKIFEYLEKYKNVDISKYQIERIKTKRI